MKKMINVIGFLLLALIAGFIGLIAYAEGFLSTLDPTPTLNTLGAYGFSAFGPILNIVNNLPSINLVSGLQLGAVALFGVAMLLILFSSLIQFRIFRFLNSLITLSTLLVFGLLAIFGLYPDATSLATYQTGVPEDFIERLLLPISGGSVSISTYAYSGLVILIVFFTILFHGLMLLDGLKNPYVKKKGKMIPLVKEETIIAEELSKFVIPNQIPSPTVTKNRFEREETLPVVATSQPFLQSTPVVVLPATPPVPEKNEIMHARQKVLQLKEKIRGLIRKQLMQQQAQAAPVIPIQPSVVVSPIANETVDLSPQMIKEEEIIEEEPVDIQQQVTNAIAQEMTQLEPKSKEQVANLINEELIKYDSLNREVVESLVAEKIGNQITNAFEQLKTDVQSLVNQSIIELKSKTAVSSTNVMPQTLESLQPLVNQAIDQSPVVQSFKLFQANPIQVVPTPIPLVNTLTEEEVVSLIQKHSPSRDEVQTLIATPIVSTQEPIEPSIDQNRIENLERIIEEQRIALNELQVAISKINQTSPASESQTVIEEDSSNRSASQAMMQSTPTVVLPATPPVLEKDGMVEAREKVSKLKEKIRNLIRMQLLQQSQNATNESVMSSSSSPQQIKDEQIIEEEKNYIQGLVDHAIDQSAVVQSFKSWQSNPIQVVPTPQVNTLTEEEVVSLIQKHSPSRDEVQTLIATPIISTQEPVDQSRIESLERIIEEQRLALKQLQTSIQNDLSKTKQDINGLSTQVKQGLKPIQTVQPQVDDQHILSIIQKHQATIKPADSMDVINGLVANEVKNQVMREPRLKAEDVKRMITEAIDRMPKPVVAAPVKTLSETDVASIIEAKLPKANVGLTETVVLGLVANEVKNQVTREPGLKAEDVKRMIAEAIERLPKGSLNNEPSVISSNMARDYSNQTLSIPVLRKKNAKAPDNEKRADQFKSVLPPEVGVTRTGKKKIIRIPFQERMAKAEAVVLNHYDELKNYLLSFQVKSRISNVGEMFRLHKEEYVKITIAGKGLKLYLALNPEDYKDSPIPVDDASDKKMYQLIPLVFKVKSELSLKRAKKLIDDLMAKKGLPQQEIPFLPWSKAFQK